MKKKLMSKSKKSDVRCTYQPVGGSGGGEAPSENPSRNLPEAPGTFPEASPKTQSQSLIVVANRKKYLITVTSDCPSPDLTLHWEG